MSTRSTTHFIDSSQIDPATDKPYLSAIVYRHSDGYPKVAGKDLLKFLRKCRAIGRNNSQTSSYSSRLEDSSYLAARYVVFLGEIFAADLSRKDFGYVPRKNRLDFISVGIMMQDPFDIEYRYTVDSGKILANGLPEVRCFKVSIDDDGNDRLCDEVVIPGNVVRPLRPITFTAKSSTNPKISYTITQNPVNGTVTCSCPQFTFRRVRCKHLLDARNHFGITKGNF